jgi:FkbM family methyltransferase
MKILPETTLYSLLGEIKNCFFLNIGANDGIENDFLYSFIEKNEWRGIYVEPGIESFTQLKNNLPNQDRFAFENIAISNYDGEIDLFFGTTTQHYSVSEKYANWMYDVVPQKRKVPCSTTRSLIQKYDVKDIDVLSIDTEGHDAVILLDFPFDLTKPKIIIVEFAHVEVAGSDVNSMINILDLNGYNCFYDQSQTNIIGVNKSFNMQE